MQVRCPGEGIRALGSERCPLCDRKAYVNVKGRFGAHWIGATWQEWRRLCIAATQWGETV